MPELDWPMGPYHSLTPSEVSYTAIKWEWEWINDNIIITINGLCFSVRNLLGHSQTCGWFDNKTERFCRRTHGICTKNGEYQYWNDGFSDDQRSPELDWPMACNTCRSLIDLLATCHGCSTCQVNTIHSAFNDESWGRTWIQIAPPASRCLPQSVPTSHISRSNSRRNTSNSRRNTSSESTLAPDPEI